MQAPSADQGFALSADDPRVEAEQGKLGKLRAELARLVDLHNTRGQQRQHLDRLIERAENFIRIEADRRFGTTLHTRGQTLRAVPVTARPAKGEAISTAIERVRGRIAELEQQLAAVEAAPVPIADIRENLKRHLRQIAQQGQARVAADGSIVWPLKRLTLSVFTRAGGPPAPPPVKEGGKPIAGPAGRVIEELNERNFRDRDPSPPTSPLLAVAGASDGFAATEVLDTAALDANHR